MALCPFSSMHKRSGFLSLVFVVSAVSTSCVAQAPGKAAVPGLNQAEHAASLSEAGHCSEALPALTKSIAPLTDRELQKRVGLDGVRCATLLQQWGPLEDFLRILDRQFPRDPEVLYVSVHAYSNLSQRSAEELAQTAPHSIPAMELDAEADEVQGRWDEAEKDYRKILEEDPRYPEIHFRLARLLLSRPNPPSDFQDQARKELQQELEIDPSNAGAQYISGELARQMQDLPAAVTYFSKAATLDPNFAEAFLDLGISLVTERKYQEAIAPLEKAVKLLPENPAGHYNLATAYQRTGRQEDATREFALQRQWEERAAANRH